MEAHPAAATDEQLRSGCEVRFQRRSGPGGQHRNKVETAVILTHLTSGIEAAASERRNQGENLKVALRRLRVKLALQWRTDWQSPSAAWQARCQQQRVVINPAHEEFPGLLAEALDALQIHVWEIPKTAQALGCSSSQLIRFLKHEPRAFQLLNHKRLLLGLRPLK